MALWLPNDPWATTHRDGAATLRGPDCLRRVWQAMGEEVKRKSLMCAGPDQGCYVA